MKNRPLLFLLPPVILLAGIALAAFMIVHRQKPATREINTAVPLVTVREVHAGDYRYEVASEGTVVPRTEIALTAEVAGRVIEMSPAFAAGGFFAKGQVLARLEPVDYRAALAQARAALSQAEVRLAQEKAQAAVARREWKRLGEGDPSPLTSRELFVRQANASVEAARAAVARAEKNLERTALTAPFAGRVLAKNVDLGQYVPPGAAVARIQAIDAVEVRLPLSEEDVAFLDLPMEPGASAVQPDVLLSAEIGGREHRWTGRIVRTEAEIDPRSRLLYAVAQVLDPYRRLPGAAGDAPLETGRFVRARITGRPAHGVFVIPRAALRGRDRVLVVDAQDKLHIRRVQVLRLQAEDAVIGDGLREGEHLCTSPVETPVEGMNVRTVPGERP